MQSAELAILIGRFEPFHLGHLALLEQALSIAPRALLIVGSARGPRMAKNPFTVEERIAAIRASLTPAQLPRVGFEAVRDYYDEPRWAGAVKAAVSRHGAGSVALVGFRKDDTSAYLSLFPEWQQHDLPRQAPIDGTALRELYFGSQGPELPEALVRAVPGGVAGFLREFRGTPHFVRLREELEALARSRAQYGSGPFVTVDALVTAADHLLLVQRGRAPGKDLWALPGGFLDGSERLLTGALRELREETGIATPDSELRAAFRSAVVFDHPQRSQRGRTITHAHHFALSGSRLPEVEGADDAQAARWVATSSLGGMGEELFEDHFQIIDHFLGISRD
jgi:bifunctional NMN adenylyltransferase/nudix hydrolase